MAFDLEKLKKNFVVQNPMFFKDAESSKSLNKKVIRYYNSKCYPGYNVSYKLLDKNNRLIEDAVNHPCFSEISYGPISENVVWIIVHSRKEITPYSIESIERWITDLNEIGFPCSFSSFDKTSSAKNKKGVFIGDGISFSPRKDIINREKILDAVSDCHNFIININDYVYKTHLISTLMLIRALYEQGICRVPQIYFQMIDENPATDKLDAIQSAHKVRHGHGGGSGHMITYPGNGGNVSSKILFENFKKSKLGVYTATSSLNYSGKWCGKPII